MDTSSLSVAERRLWEAFPKGHHVDLGEGDPTEPDFDPDSWDDERRTVRAEVIARLLLGVQPPEAGYIARLVLSGARITGELNLNEGETPYELALNRCWLEVAPDLSGAISKSVSFVATRLPGLMAAGWQVKGHVDLRQSLVSDEVNLDGAHIGAHLDLSGAQLTNSGMLAISADGLRVEQDMYCGSDFVAEGEISMIGARVGGVLSFAGASISNAGGVALFADGLAAEQGLFCGNGFTVAGAMRLCRARIGGSISLAGAELSNDGDPAFWADAMIVDGDLIFGGGFVSNGEVRMIRAQVNGELNLRNTTLTNPGGDALDAYGLTVGRDMHCGTGFSATGEVSLFSAKIGGRLDFSGASLSNPDATALFADSLNVGYDLTFSGGFKADGKISLDGAHVVGQLSFGPASLVGVEGEALYADGLQVDRDLFCHNGLTVDGQFILTGAKIGGELSVIGVFSNPGATALDLENLTVGRDVSFLDNFSVTGETLLDRARIGGQVMIGGSMANPEGKALAASQMMIDGDLSFLSRYAAMGEVDIYGARIGGELIFNGKITNPGSMAVWADGITVAKDLTCLDGFAVIGGFTISGAQAGGETSFYRATFTNLGGAAIDMERLTTQVLHLGATVHGEVDLTQAKVGILVLPDITTQPPMWLGGLVYTDLDPDPDPPIRHRIKWLAKDPAGFHPQPYEQLANYYRMMGHDRQARQILLAKLRARRGAIQNSSRLPRPLRFIVRSFSKTPSWLMDALAGYGYVPARAFFWLVVATTAGAIALRGAALPTPTGNRDLNAALLAFDTILPTSPFGLRDQVTFVGAPFIVVAILLQILGYALTLALLPAISRALSRSDKPV